MAGRIPRIWTWKWIAMANKSPFDQSKPVQLCICSNCPFEVSGIDVVTLVLATLLDIGVGEPHSLAEMDEAGLGVVDTSREVPRVVRRKPCRRTTFTPPARHPFSGGPGRNRELRGFLGWNRMTFAVAWAERTGSRAAWAVFPRKGESRPAPPTQRRFPSGTTHAKAIPVRIVRAATDNVNGDLNLTQAHQKEDAFLGKLAMDEVRPLLLGEVQFDSIAVAHAAWTARDDGGASSSIFSTPSRGQRALMTSQSTSLRRTERAR